MAFKRIISFILSCLLVTGFMPVAAQDDTAFYQACSQLSKDWPAEKQNRLLVQASRLPALKHAPLKILQQDDFYVLQFEETGQARAVYEQLKQEPAVSIVEFDQPVSIDEPQLQAAENYSISDNGETNEYWWLSSLGIPAYRSTLSGLNRSVKVAVIDMGITPDPYFSGKTTGGYDFVDDDDNPDSQGENHGALVSAIILEATKGLNVKVMPLRAIPGHMLQVINAIRYAANQGVDVVNLSLVYYVHSDLMHQAIQQCLNQGMVVVAAAGNANVDMDRSSAEPAHMREIITVGSCESDFTRSNWGRGYVPCYGQGMDLAAYGSYIKVDELQSGYVGFGTSFSAPIISGMAALLKYEHPSITCSEVEAYLKSIARDIGEPGFDVFFGEGIPVLDRAPAIAQDLLLSDSSVKLAEGQQKQLSTTSLPYGSVGANVKWSISDPSIADVSHGLIKAKAVGTAVITAEMENGKSKTCSLEVIPSTPLTRLPYTDIEALDEQMLDAVEWCYNEQIMTGLDESTFGPYNSLNRAQLATILYRLNGSPATDISNPFRDVDEGVYFTEAAKWAYEQGILLGYGDGRLGPSDTVTREQLSLILYRIASESGSSEDPSAGLDNPLSGYTDTDKISSHDMHKALEWAIGHDYLETDNQKIEPSGDALRKTIALALYLYQCDL